MEGGLVLRSISAKAAARQVVCFLVPLVVIFAFFRDLFAPDWPAWVLSPLMVFGFYGVVSVVGEQTIGRLLLWEVALITVAFAGIYDILDAILDVAIVADWPILLIAPLFVFALWSAMSALLSMEDD